MKEIGGYFNFELSVKSHFLHDDGVLVNSGANALLYVLKSLGRIDRVYVPYFTCDSVLKPIKSLHISYVFYHINENLEIKENIICGDYEYIIINNYFGIKDEYIKKVVNEYENHLIIDNAQALFFPRMTNVPAIYSPRKFIGIPDGGIAYVCTPLSESIEVDKSYERCSHLLKRYDEGASGAYADFKKNDYYVGQLSLRKMSFLTRSIMSSVDYNNLCKRRITNFKKLHSVLGESNLLNCVDDSFLCPLVYPYLSKVSGLKKYLIDNNVFCATYWPNVFDWCESSDFEYYLANELVAIPIDQRYDEDDMNRIIKIIKDTWK